jgi:hypothetical protein
MLARERDDRNGMETSAHRNISINYQKPTSSQAAIISLSHQTLSSPTTNHSTLTTLANLSILPTTTKFQQIRSANIKTRE